MSLRSSTSIPYPSASGHLPEIWQSAGTPPHRTECTQNFSRHASVIKRCCLGEYFHLRVKSVSDCAVAGGLSTHLATHCSSALPRRRISDWRWSMSASGGATEFRYRFSKRKIWLL